MGAAVGQRFGALVVLRSALQRRRQDRVRVVCDCGREETCYVAALVAGRAVECHRCARIRCGDSFHCPRGFGETYVADVGGIFKIGWSRNVAARALVLGRRGAPAIMLLRVPGGEHEPLLHALCFESHERREWFRSTEQTRALIRDLALTPIKDRPARVRAVYRARFAEPGSVAHLRRFASPAWRDDKPTARKAA